MTVGRKLEKLLKDPTAAPGGVLRHARLHRLLAIAQHRVFIHVPITFPGNPVEDRLLGRTDDHDLLDGVLDVLEGLLDRVGRDPHVLHVEGHDQGNRKVGGFDRLFGPHQ